MEVLFLTTASIGFTIVWNVTVYKMSCITHVTFELPTSHYMLRPYLVPRPVDAVMAAVGM